MATSAWRIKYNRRWGLGGALLASAENSIGGRIVSIPPPLGLISRQLIISDYFDQNLQFRASRAIHHLEAFVWSNEQKQTGNGNRDEGEQDKLYLVNFGVASLISTA